MKQRLKYLLLILAASASLILAPVVAYADPLSCSNGAPEVGTQLFDNSNDSTDTASYCANTGTQHIFSQILCDFVSMLDTVLDQVYCSMQYSLTSVLSIVLTIYVAIFGMQVLMGTAQMNARDILTRLFKIGAVMTFATQSSWGIGYIFNFFVSLMNEGSMWAVGAFPNAVNANSGGFSDNAAQPMQIYGFLDTYVQNLIIAPFTNQNSNIIGLFAVMAIALPPVFMMAVYWLVSTIALLARAMITFMLCVSGIALLVSLSPIFLSFMLFQPTVSFFESWLRHLTSFAFQVIIVFGIIIFWMLMMAQFMAFFYYVDPDSGVKYGLENVVFSFDSTKVKGAKYGPGQRIGLCPFTIYNDTFPPYIACDDPDFSGESDQVIADNTIEPADFIDDPELVAYFMWNLVSMLIVLYATNEALKKAPEIAVNVVGPSTALGLNPPGWTGVTLGRNAGMNFNTHGTPFGKYAQNFNGSRTGSWVSKMMGGEASQKYADQAGDMVTGRNTPSSREEKAAAAGISLKPTRPLEAPKSPFGAAALAGRGIGDTNFTTQTVKTPGGGTSLVFGANPADPNAGAKKSGDIAGFLDNLLEMAKSPVQKAIDAERKALAAPASERLASKNGEGKPLRRGSAAWFRERERKKTLAANASRTAGLLAANAAPSGRGFLSVPVSAPSGKTADTKKRTTARQPIADRHILTPADRAQRIKDIRDIREWNEREGFPTTGSDIAEGIEQRAKVADEKAAADARAVAEAAAAPTPSPSPVAIPTTPPISPNIMPVIASVAAGSVAAIVKSVASAAFGGVAVALPRDGKKQKEDDKPSSPVALAFLPLLALRLRGVTAKTEKDIGAPSSPMAVARAAITASRKRMDTVMKEVGVAAPAAPVKPPALPVEPVYSLETIAGLGKGESTVYPLTAEPKVAAPAAPVKPPALPVEPVYSLETIAGLGKGESTVYPLTAEPKVAAPAAPVKPPALPVEPVYSLETIAGLGKGESTVYPLTAEPKVAAPAAPVKPPALPVEPVYSLETIAGLGKGESTVYPLTAEPKVAAPAAPVKPPALPVEPVYSLETIAGLGKGESTVYPLVDSKPPVAAKSKAPDTPTGKPSRTAAPDAPRPHLPGMINHGGNAAATGKDLYDLGTAITKRDTEGALAAGGSLAANSATLADDLAHGAGLSSGFISRTLGKVGIGATVATTLVDVWKIQAEGGVDRKQQSTETVITGGVAFGVGMAAGAGLTAGASALGGGMVLGTVATGGTILIAAGAATATAYAMQKADQAMYGAEDTRFGANLENKQHMIALANGKFHDQLTDPKTGKVDLTDMTTINKLSGLLVKEVEAQKAVMEANSSYAPRWTRGVLSDSVNKQESARSSMNIAESAQKEVMAQISGMQAAKIAHADAIQKIDGLSKLVGEDAKRLNDIMKIAQEGKYGINSDNRAWLAEKLGGDKDLANGLIKTATQQGDQMRQVELVTKFANDIKTSPELQKALDNGDATVLMAHLGGDRKLAEAVYKTRQEELAAAAVAAPAAPPPAPVVAAAAPPPAITPTTAPAMEAPAAKPPETVAVAQQEVFGLTMKAPDDRSAGFDVNIMFKESAPQDKVDHSRDVATQEFIATKDRQKGDEDPDEEERKRRKLAASAPSGDAAPEVTPSAGDAAPPREEMIVYGQEMKKIPDPVATNNPDKPEQV